MSLKKVQIQLMNEETGEFIEDVTPLTEAESVLYTNPTPTVSAHGGIPAGSTFENVSVKKMLDDILYPYTKPTVSLTANPAAAIMEKGASVESIKLTANITKKSEDIKKVEFTKDGAVVGTISSPKAGGGAETYTYAEAVKTNSQFKARVTDKKMGLWTQTQCLIRLYILFILAH